MIHWTANTGKGANAQANRNYFENGSPGPDGKPRFASAHYIVDDSKIVQCIPGNEVAFHVGDRPKKIYMPDGLKMLEGEPATPRGVSHTPNFYTVGAEMCVNADGDWRKTYANTAQLAAHLLLMYGLGIDGLYRHFDITGKNCPRPFLDDNDWRKFRHDVVVQMNIFLLKVKRAVVNTGRDTLNVRKHYSINSEISYTLSHGEPVACILQLGDWVCIGTFQEWVNSKFLKFI